MEDIVTAEMKKLSYPDYTLAPKLLVLAFRAPESAAKKGVIFRGFGNPTVANNNEEEHPTPASFCQYQQSSSSTLVSFGQCQ